MGFLIGSTRLLDMYGEPLIRYYYTILHLLPSLFNTSILSSPQISSNRNSFIGGYCPSFTASVVGFSSRSYWSMVPWRWHHVPNMQQVSPSRRGSYIFVISLDCFVLSSSLSIAIAISLHLRSGEDPNCADSDIGHSVIDHLTYLGYNEHLGTYNGC